MSKRGRAAGSPHASGRAAARLPPCRSLSMCLMHCFWHTGAVACFPLHTLVGAGAAL